MSFTNFRYINPLGLFLKIILLCFSILPLDVFAQSNIVRAEYFYDADPGFGNGTAISITPSTGISNQTFSTSVAGLTSGVHQLFLRVQTADGLWSITNRSLLYKPGASAYFTPKITRAEYFFDTDPGYGNGSSIAITPSVNLNNVSFDANVDQLSVGIHQLFIRVQDASGKWSISSRNLLYKPAQQSVNNNTQITKAEYFFDADPGFGNGTDISITPGFSIIDKSFNADVSSLSTGIHQMFIRVKDSRGVWSICNRTILYKPNSNNSNETSDLVKAEYFFDNDPGFGNGIDIPITQGPQLLNVGFQSDVSSLSAGLHQLFIRVKDVSNKWSVSNRTFFYKAPTASRQLSKIIRAEYFIDQDPGFGNAVPYPMSGAGILVDSIITINISGLSDGEHYFYLRVLDNKGKWSVTNQSAFSVADASNENFISITGVNKRNLCSGDSIEVGIHASGNYAAGNRFNVELSNAVGNFSTPQVIGTSATASSRSIWCVVPSGLVGDSYKIRVISNDNLTVSDPFYAQFEATCISSVPPTITLNSSVDLNCGGIATGSIDIAVSGGTAPYSYLWTKTGSPLFTASTQDITGLNAGEYNVLVTDSLGNSDVFSVYINGPAPLKTTATASPINCNGSSTGATSVNVSGGTAPYNYLWNNGATSSTITAVAAGEYTVVVSDSRGCQSVSNVTVNQAVSLTLTMSGVDVNCQGMATGSASVIVSGGNPNYTYLWSNGNNTANISNVLPGKYFVRVIDAVGCIKSDSIVLNYLHEAPQATISANGSTTICQGDSVQLTSSTGHTYLWNVGAISNSIYAKNAGNYRVTVTDINGCSATSTDVTIVNTPAPTWYIDADRDGYGSGNAVSQCSRPTNGFLASELISVNGDCNDASIATNVNRQYFKFSSNSAYANKLISQLSGSSYTDFRFEVDYVDSSNNLPLTGFPRLILDYEGNGSYTDANDRVLVMTPDDPSDVTTSNGKRYFVSVNGLPNGVNWKTSVIVSDANNCSVRLGNFDYPDVLQQPNVTIFASDISFSQRRPDPSSPITVSALVRNESDYAAVDFVTHLVNQFDTNIIYPDITVDFIPPHGVKTIQWNITTPSVPAWCPMQVTLDKTNVIAEWNELDNNAVRPFVNGNFPVPGRIIISSSVSPKVSYSFPGNVITVSGLANYTGTAVPLPDSSVAGATVTIKVIETGAEFSGYTNAAGYYTISFPAPIAFGNYHVEGTITDYTLEGSFNDDFTIIPRPEPCSLPDLYATIILNRSTIVQGNSVTAQLRVVNGGMTAANSTSISLLSQSGGTQLTNTEIQIPALASGQSYTVPIGTLIYNTPGTYYLYANVDANTQVNECNESNGAYVGVTVTPNLPDIVPFGGPYGTVYNCPNPSTGFTLYNAGGVASGSFTTRVTIKHNGTQVANYNHRVDNINPGSRYSFDVPYNYQSLGSYTYKVECDIPTNTGGEVVELDEYNNEANYGELTVVACKPNLYVSACGSNVVEPYDPAPPGFITLKASILNGGNSTASGPIKIRFAYSSGLYFDTTYDGSLSAGQFVIVSCVAPVPNSTSTLLTITVDPDNTVEEFSEGDNSFSDMLCHDFEAVPLCGYNTFNGTAYLNQIATPFVGVALHHLYSASQVKVKFEVSGPGINGTINLGYGILNNARNYCSCPYAVTLPTPFAFTSMGVYTFTMTIDPDNTYLECDESNNVMVTQWNVVNTPDMRILSQFINPTMLNPSPGQSVNFDVSYENTGRTNVNDSMKLKLLVNGVAHDSIRVRGLANGDHFTVRMPKVWSSLISGAHIIRAIIDADKEIAENDEMNNEATRAIIVGESANLFFRSLVPSQSSPELGQNINFIATIGNSGSQPCNAKVSFYYINNNQDSVLIGQSNFVIAANRDTVVSMPWMVADESTNIIAVISNSSVLEFDYNDNSATTLIGNFNISFQNQNASCSGNADGILTAIASGGYPPYFYSWSNGRTGATLTAAAGVYRVTVTDSLGQSITATDTLIKDELIEISALAGLTDICNIAGTNETTTYSVDSIPGANYIWSASTPNITLIGNGNAIQAKFSSSFTTGTISVSISNVCGGTVVRTISVNKPATLSMNSISTVTQTLVSNVCGARVYRYKASKVLNATGYLWTLPTSVGGITGVTVDSGDIAKDSVIKVKYASNANAIAGDSIKVMPWTPCSNGLINAYKLSNTLLAIPASPATLTVTPVSTNTCGSKMYRYRAPALTAALTSGSSSVAPVTGYLWSFKGTLGNNAVIDSGTINSPVILVKFTSNAAAFAGDSVCVAYTSLCGNSLNKCAKLTNTAILVPAAPVSIIITPISSNICGNRLYRYTAPALPSSTATAAAANGYVWSFKGTLGNNAVVDSGSLTSRIVVMRFTSNNAAATGDSVKLYYTSNCGNSLIKASKLSNLLLSVPAAPSSITITPILTNICSGKVYRYSAPALPSATATATAAKGYLWSFVGSLGATASIDSGSANSRIIRVVFSSNAAAISGDSVKLLYLSDCGNSINKASKLTNVLVSKPAIPASITITPVTTNVCSGKVYRYTAPALPAATSTVTAATGRKWVFKGRLFDNYGQITSGTDTSRIIEVTYSSGIAASGGDSVLLYYTSACGNTINKAAKLSNLATTLPAAPASITPLLVSDVCGARIYRYTAPVLPAPTTATASATSAIGYLWTMPTGSVGTSGNITMGSDTSRVIEVTYSSNAAAVAGDTIKVRYTTANCGNSTYKGLKLTNLVKNGCPPVSNGTISTTRVVSNTLVKDEMELKVFPNPTHSSFTLQINSLNQFPVDVSIIDVQGKLIKRITTKLKEVSSIGNELQQGIYIIKVVQGKIIKTVKVVKE